MQENEKDPEVQPVAEPVAAKAVAPVEENTGNGAETTLVIIANIVLWHHRLDYLLIQHCLGTKSRVPIHRRQDIQSQRICDHGHGAGLLVD